MRCTSVFATVTRLTMNRPYTLKPLPSFGAEISGIQLSQQQPEETVSAIKADVTRRERPSCRFPRRSEAAPQHQLSSKLPRAVWLQAPPAGVQGPGHREWRAAGGNQPLVW